MYKEGLETSNMSPMYFLRGLESYPEASEETLEVLRSASFKGGGSLQEGTKSNDLLERASFST